MYHVIAILVICIWGTTFVSTKVLLGGGLSPSGIFFIRFVLAYVGMLAVCHRRAFCATWRDEALMLIAGITGGSLYFLTENTALEYAQAGNVSLIVCLAPIATVVFSLFMSQERKRVSPRLWLGMLVALAGVVPIVSDETETTANAPVLGGCLALCAALLWAVYQNIVKPLSDHYGALLLTRKVFGYGLLTIVAYEFTLGFFSENHGFSFFVEEVNMLLENPTLWSNILFLGLVASLLCYFVWNKVVERLGAVVSANYIYLNPVTTCLFSAIFLGERLTPWMAIGGVAVLFGVYIAVEMPLRKAK